MNEELSTTLEELTSVESELSARNQELIAQQESLTQSHKALREANRQLNLLSSITRHDILNKITVLNGYLTLIRDEITNAPISGYLDILESVVGTIEAQIAFTPHLPGSRIPGATVDISQISHLIHEYSRGDTDRI